MRLMVVMGCFMFLFPWIVLGQRYQIHIQNDEVFLNGEPANRFNKKGNKHGTWIDYDILGPTIITHKTEQIMIIQSCYFGDSAYCTREVSREPEKLVRTDTLDDIAYRIRSLGQYLNGKKHGTWLQYFPGGRIRKEVLYEKGKIKQTFKVYFETGKLKFEGAEMENGNGYILKEYSESGELLETTQMNPSGLENKL